MCPRSLGAIVAVLPTFVSEDFADSHVKQPFNGQNMDRRKHVGKGLFAVKNGLPKTIGGMDLLTYTEEKFAYVVIRVVYKTRSPEENSGVLIRLLVEPEDALYPVHFGNAVQIQGNSDAL